MLFGGVFLFSAAGLKLIQAQVGTKGDAEGTLYELISDQLNFSVSAAFVVGLLFLIGGIIYRVHSTLGKWTIFAGIVLFIAGTTSALVNIWTAAGSTALFLILTAFWLFFTAMFSYMGVSILKHPTR
jgi:hypothetical protein